MEIALNPAFIAYANFLSWVDPFSAPTSYEKGLEHRSEREQKRNAKREGEVESKSRFRIWKVSKW